VRKLPSAAKPRPGDQRAVGPTVQAAEQAGRMLDGLVPDIERTSALVSQISGASQELATGAAQVNLAIQQLDKVTQQNTSASEQMSSTAEELSGQAGSLRAAMGFFRTQEGAGSGVASASRADQPSRPRHLSVRKPDPRQGRCGGAKGRLAQGRRLQLPAGLG
jgi:methyl-accepting chemotaxis protein